MQKERANSYCNKRVVVVHKAGKTQGVCKAVDAYLNIAVQTETKIHIIKGDKIEEIREE